MYQNLLSDLLQLEKEALVKGTPIGQALDIEIPPPRPKRKPSNPYPRKTSIGTPTSQVESKDGKSGNPLPQTEHILDLEKEPVPEVLLCVLLFLFNSYLIMKYVFIH